MGRNAVEEVENSEVADIVAADNNMAPDDGNHASELVFFIKGMGDQTIFDIDRDDRLLEGNWGEGTDWHRNFVAYSNGPAKLEPVKEIVDTRVDGQLPAVLGAAEQLELQSVSQALRPDGVPYFVA